MCKASRFYLIEKNLDLLEKVLESPGKVLEFHITVNSANPVMLSPGRPRVIKKS